MALPKGCSCRRSNASCSVLCCRCFKQNLLMLLILLGVIAGIGLGICLRVYVPAFQQPELHPRHIYYLYFPAEIFLRVMTFMSVPLLVSSLVSGIGTLDIKSSGRIGLYVMCYYLATTAIAIIQGFIFVYAIKPGKNIQPGNITNTTSEADLTDGSNRIDSFLDMIRNTFPDNLITATFQMHKTSTHYKELVLSGQNVSIPVEQFETEKVDAINILGITLMSIVFSVALSTIGSKGKQLFVLFDIIFETVMKIMKVLLWLYPVGILFMLATTVVQLQHPLEMLRKLSLFIVTALAGFFTHLFIALPLMYFLFLRKNPYRLLVGCLRALVSGFATNSSALTLPVTMNCLKRLGYKESIIRFMAPIGATINMDGTALYHAIAPIFVATLNGMNPGPSQIIILGLTAVAISIGSPTTIDTMVLYVIMFKSIGLPLKDIGLLLTFDWIMVRFRTMVNVSGDCFGVAIVQKLSSSKSKSPKDEDIDADTDDVELSYLNKAAEEHQ